MTHYDTIVAIYNPNSTNDAKQKAEAFQAAAEKVGVDITLLPTDHAGHAAEIAHDIVAKHNQPLLISVSGDGGYNELINGVMDAKKSSQKNPVVAILAAGNANDHKRTTRGDTPLLELIVRAAPRPLDLLRLQTEQLDRYAHSYIGLGITPTVGIQLNKHDLNRFNEIGLVIHSLASFAPFRIKRDGIVTAYSNLLFANVDSMSKVIKLDTADNSVHDGKFEVISDVWRGKLRLLLHLLRLVFFGHAHSPQYSQYEFTTVENTAVQMDGEIETLSSEVRVSITAQKAAILSLY